MTTQRTYRMIIGLDFSDMSEVVMETALDTATRHENPEIHVLTVFEPPRGLRKGSHVDHEGQLEELQKRLRAFTNDKLGDFGRAYDNPDHLEGWQVILHSRVGKPAEVITDLAWEAEADLIVVGRHSGERRLFSKTGNVPRMLLDSTRCPVLVVQPSDYGVSEHIDEQRARQCPECVTVRRDSKGTSWFCDEHRDYKLSRSVYMAHHSATWPIGGGPLL